MFKRMSNTPCNNILFSGATISGMSLPADPTITMHPSAQRLYEAVKQLRGLDITVAGKAAVGRAIDVTSQNLNAWEKRGVSQEAAIKVQALLGVSPNWLTKGEGPMLIAQSMAERYPVSTTRQRPVWVIGKGQGGLPERIWTDGDYPVGASDEFADIATADALAFLVPVVGDSMSPRYQQGEYALVEPSTEPDIEDDVLVRLATGETMLKRLISRRAGLLRFASWNDPTIHTYEQEQVVWYYYVAHPVPARKIKTRM